MHKTANSFSLDAPLRLPCGAVLKNRLVKAAMSDSLGDGRGNVTDEQVRLYQRWAQGGAALSIIGEVQISPFFPEKPGNLVLIDGVDVAALARLAEHGSENGAQIWPQLGHAGALSHAAISTPKGPSALSTNGLQSAGMSLTEIKTLPDAYAKAAKMAQDVGFGGIQIHAAHGFLLSQFLSPLFNKRSDSYGGAISNRFRIIAEIIDAIRRVVGPYFPLGIKINASDGLVGGLNETDALQVIQHLDKTSIDLIEVSGGTYFPGAPSSSEAVSGSGPYYVNFSKQAKHLTDIPITVTGGFKRQSDALDALATGAADAIGCARTMVLDPCLSRNWGEEHRSDPEFPTFTSPAPGAVTAWYSMRLTALGQDKEDEFQMSATEALEAYNARDERRNALWKERFLKQAGA